MKLILISPWQIQAELGSHSKLRSLTLKDHYPHHTWKTLTITNTRIDADMQGTLPNLVERS